MGWDIENIVSQVFEYVPEMVVVVLVAAEPMPASMMLADNTTLKDMAATAGTSAQLFFDVNKAGNYASQENEIYKMSALISWLISVNPAIVAYLCVNPDIVAYLCVNPDMVPYLCANTDVVAYHCVNLDMMAHVSVNPHMMAYLSVNPDMDTLLWFISAYWLIS
ncbi:hypothetical protein CHS0354_029740 [Potamilus streckersoni]|uniref:Uncharacterized protein n=1 Tax=Potamilus streckersoni TaxID=2493646 RepID=A0AAE0TH49_9BIVA|nr:hypothetical protein CHS0354_029740 [Potamilus streckersoni]